MGQNKQGEKEEENNGDNRNKDIVLKAFMHCEGCSEKVSKCLRGFDGVEQVVVDRENKKVIVKGKMAEPVKVLERLRKKYSKNVELISPKPRPQKEEAEKKKEEELPPVKTVTLKTYIHCEGCANDIQKSIQKMKGVVSVDVNKEDSQVIVRGVIEATQLIQHIKKRLGKHAQIIDQQPSKREANKPNPNVNEDITMFSYPPQYSTQYLYPIQTFSDENVFSCSLM